MNADYSRGQKIFHWLLAVLVLFWLFVSGNFVESAEGEQKAMILMFHSGGAIIIGLLMIIRFRIRQYRKVSVMESLKSWEKIWSTRVHLAFYALVSLMVMSGLLQAMFFEMDVRIFGALNVTIGHNESTMVIFHNLHSGIAMMLKILIALHVLAALKHQLIDKQPMLRRMF